MKDQGNSDNHDREPQAPKFMRPRRPVLDEPLEEAEEGAQEEVEARQPDSEKTPPPERISLDATQELNLEMESPEQADLTAGETKSTQAAVHSPYFPRGIYEDAQSVEAYYGRGDAEVEVEHFSETEPETERSKVLIKSRWLIVAFAILMIVVLLFLALTEGIPLTFF